MEKILKGQFKNIREQNGGINPDRAWVLSNRNKLLNQIKNTTTTTEKRGFDFTLPYRYFKALIPNQIYAPVRVMAVFMLIGVITFSSWIASASATETCLPGDICYGVKLATEKTQAMVVSVTGTNKDKASLHLDFAAKRAQEAKQVVAEQKPESNKNAQVAIKGLEENIQLVTESIKESAISAPEAVMELKNEVQQKTTEIKQVLKEVDNNLNTLDLSQANKLVKETNLTAVEAVVTTKEAGKVEVSDAEVKTMVQDVIAQTIKENVEMKDTAKATSDVVEKITTPITVSLSTSTLIVESPLVLTFSTGTEKVIASNSTAMTASSTASVKNVVEVVTKKVDETQKSLEEAKELVNNDHLMEAIQKIKDVSEDTKDAAKTVSEVKKAVEEVTKTPVIVPVVLTIPSSTTSSVTVSTSSVKIPTTTIKN